MKVKFRAFKTEEEALMTKAVILKAVGSCGYALRYVPEALMSEKVMLKAVENDGDALQVVPKNLMTETDAPLEDPRYFNVNLDNNDFKFVSVDKIKEELK